MAFAFICGVLLVFGLVLLLEQDFSQGKDRVGPGGLVHWLISGNWTAKLGGLLISLGVGALLRYLLLHVALPAVDKLAVGALISVALGTAAGALRRRPDQRAISVALAGAALAVAYLTAYSAYGFFHFVASLQALALLFLVAGTATVVAITQRALSIAVLGMVGAYIAPAFALVTPGPFAVYGYYLGASLLTLLTVWQRGWRPLIHLSFLFTLAGALFFGWTRVFYTPEHYAQMEPLLLALVAVHLAMSIVERSPRTAPAGTGTDAHADAGVDDDRSWTYRLDQAYFILLPLAAATLSLLIAPSLRREGALGLLGLGLLWLTAAAVQHLRRARSGVAYLCVAAVFLLSAGLIAVTDVPLFLVATVALCAVLAAGERLPLRGGSELWVTALMLLSAASYMLQAIFAPTSGSALLNPAFGEHVILGLAMLVAGRSLHRRDRVIAPLLLMYAASWLFVAFARELVRLDLENVAQIAYGAALVATAVCIGVAQVRSRAPGRLMISLVGIALFVTAVASASRFGAAWLLPLMLAGHALYSLLALQCDRAEAEEELAGAVARSVLPLLLLPWAMAFNAHLARPHEDVIWAFLAGGALSASLQAQWLVRRTRVWPNWLSPVGFVVVGILLVHEALFHIEREAWDVAFELIALTYLIETARFLTVAENRDATGFNYAAIAATVSVGAAMVLRLFGPPGTLTIWALNDLLLPAIASLLCAAIGGGLAWYATRGGVRTLWSFGAVLLIVAAVKLILFDFGSLGQLGNILAMIGAGGVFLLVAWLAPFPPKREPLRPKASPSPQGPRPAVAAVATAAASPGVTAAAPMRAAASTASQSSSGRGWAWILAIVLAIFVYGRWVVPEQRGQAVPLAMRIQAAPRPILHASAQLAVASPESPDRCKQFVESLPANYRVYSIGAEQDAAMGDDAGTLPVQASVRDVAIPPDLQAIVLAVAADGPVLWRLHEAQADQVVGVVLSGTHRSNLSGLSRFVPVLHAARSDNARCGYFAPDGVGSQSASGFLGGLLGRGLDGNIATAASPARVDLTPGVAQAAPQSTVAVLSAHVLLAQTGTSIDVTARAQSQCRAGSAGCAISCGTALTGESSEAPPRICEIVYQCPDAPARMARLEEGDTVHVTCPVGNRLARQAMRAQSSPALEVLKATYWSPRKHQTLDVTAQVQAQCRFGPTGCLIGCGNHLAGDPDFGQVKLCDIDFRCANGMRQTVRTQEGRLVRLECR